MTSQKILTSLSKKMLRLAKELNKMPMDKTFVQWLRHYKLIQEIEMSTKLINILNNAENN